MPRRFQPHIFAMSSLPFLALDWRVRCSQTLDASKNLHSVAKLH